MTRIEGALAGVTDRKVLVVDDNPVNTKLVRGLLTRAGIRDVGELQDSTLIESTLDEFDPDLIILDLMMPGLDGFEVLELLARRSIGAYLPVIVVTADHSRASTERALDLGAHDFVGKPFNASELILRARNLLMSRVAYLELCRSRAFLRTRLGLFEPDLAESDENTAIYSRAIDETIRTRSFTIALQPVVDMHTGAIVSAEALARFPEGVLASTGAWFAAALQTGQVSQLEVATAMRAMEHLDELPDGTRLSLNMSPSTVLFPGLDALGPDVPWSRLTLELTEHVPVSDYAALRQCLQPYIDQGLLVAIDDTGAGFASLRHILDLEPHVIKLDIGITRGVDTDPSRSALAAMISHFADAVGIRVVAEGVETEAERDALISLGLRYGQGYLFGRPATPEQRAELGGLPTAAGRSGPAPS